MSTATITTTVAGTTSNKEMATAAPCTTSSATTPMIRGTRISPRRRQASVGTTIFTKMLFESKPPVKKQSTSNKGVMVVQEGAFVSKTKEDDEAKDQQEASSTSSMAAWIVGFAVLDRAPKLDEVRDAIKTKLVDRFVRFNSIVKLNKWTGEAVFEELNGEEENLDWDYHVPEIDSDKWSMEQVYTYLEGLNSFEYDLNKPLWRYLVLNNLENGQSVMITCINHVIGDGLSLVEVTNALYDTVPPSPTAVPVKDKPQSKPNKMDFLTKLGILAHGITFGASLPLMRSDASNPLRMPQGVKPIGQKRLALAPSISLEKVKEVKNRMEGTTVNDVLMGVMTLTLKRLFEEEKALAKNTASTSFTRYQGENASITAQFPISTRKHDEGALDVFGEPHNKVSYGFFKFDLDVWCREQAVWSCKEQIDLIKLSPAPLMIELNLKLGGWLLPNRLLLDIASHVSNLGTAQLSNVPAPSSEVTLFGGCRVLDMQFFLFSPLACYLGILTYNNRVNAAFNLDTGLGVDPKRMAELFSQEFDLLHEEISSKTEQKGPLKAPKRKDLAFYRVLGLLSLLLAAYLVFVLSAAWLRFWSALLF